MWSRSGDELFYIEPGNPSHMVAVSIDIDPEFNFGTPKELFEWSNFTPNTGRIYDVSSDGNRFLMIKQPQWAQKIIVVTNWFEELKERVPVE